VSGRQPGCSRAAAGGCAETIAQSVRSRGPVNWDAIGAVAELVGAIGVIASLVYLGVQIRQNTRSTNAAAFHDLNSSLSQMSATLVANRDAARLFRVGMQDLNALEPDEVVQFFNLLNFNFRHLESAYVQYKQGIREERSWVGWQSDIELYGASRSVHVWWSVRREAYDEDFRAVVDGAISASTSPPAA